MIECGVRNELVLVKIPILLVPNHFGHRNFVPFKYMSCKVYVSKMFLSILIIFCLSKLPSWLSNSQCLNHVFVFYYCTMIECGVRNELVLVKIPILLVPNHFGHRNFVPFKYMSCKVYVSKMFLSILIIFCLSKLPSWLSNSQCLNHVLWNPQSTHWLVI